ncbi:HD-GYP domain-containing protein [Thalassoroseus pseudoceratinae]|uniref:HD-GYP domain-containing protein n=1 Tax=Thalassoroseus pseudoceratinae TaxID=2713176 RepID=UPI00142148AD|nr:HD-GYP domain-containing protein [Thalassoroseus pseudoceratinae]
MSALDLIDDLNAVCAKLQQTFGSEFHIWEENADRWEVPIGMERRLLNDELRVWLTEDRERLQDGHSISRLQSDGRTALAIPLTGEDDEESMMVAIGFVEDNFEQLATIAGDLSQTSLLSTFEISSLKSMVAEYRRQVTDDFEERTFLRHVTRYVEHCSLTTSLQGVANEILPRLQQLAGFHSLHLVIPNDGQLGLPSDQSTRNLSFGHQEIPQAEVRALIQQFAATDGTRPVVLATRRCPQLKEVCPVAYSVALTTLMRKEERFGWLVAINGEHNQTRPSRRNKSSVVSELGSVEASLLESTGILIASHAHNRRLYAAKEEMTIELVRSLVAALDARDEYTCGHSDRVACMSKHLAKCMGLPETECQIIYLSGLLHDLGKIGISDSVLLKPGRLTDEEFEKIKQHPQRGYDLLKRLKPLKPMLPGVLHHHEAWDGSGYPHGLAGEEIPLIGRIMAVSDSFDAMTSNRPYRNGMSLAKAEAIMRDGAGRQWQAELVDVFFENVEEMTAICANSRERTDRLLGRYDDPNTKVDDRFDSESDLTKAFQSSTNSLLCLDTTL